MNLESEKQAKELPNGGALVDEKGNVTSPKQGGYAFGRSHKESGIKAINKATNQPIEFEGGEVIITKPAVEDQELREFEGEMLTNREILSRINESGGGVSFAEKGAEIPTEISCYGKSFKFGGENLTDYEITQKISSCGCNHNPEYADGGETKPNNISEKMLSDIAWLVDLQYKKQNKLPSGGWDINLFKSSFFNKVKKLDQSAATDVLNELKRQEEEKGVKPVFSSNHKIWDNYEKSVIKTENNSEIIVLKNGDKNFVSSQIYEITGDDFLTGEFYNLEGNPNQLDTGRPFYHKASGKVFVVKNDTENLKSAPKYNVGNIVSYKSGDLEVEDWIGKVAKVVDLGNEYAYRINAYSKTFPIMFDGENTNEKYEAVLRKPFVNDFENVRSKYENQYLDKLSMTYEIDEPSYRMISVFKSAFPELAVKQIIDLADKIANYDNKKRDLSAIAEAINYLSQDWTDFDRTKAEKETIQRLEAFGIIDKENNESNISSEKPLSRDDFFKTYIAAHKDIRSKSEAEKEAIKKMILRDGFFEGMNVNAVPISESAVKSENLVDNWTQYKKGDYIYLLKSSGVVNSTNGLITKEGYKPTESEVVKIKFDGQSIYEAYSNQFYNNPNSYTKKDIENLTKKIFEIDSKTGFLSQRKSKMFSEYKTFSSLAENYYRNKFDSENQEFTDAVEDLIKNLDYKTYDLVATNAGGVLVVSDKNQTENGDYKNIAFVYENGDIKYFEDNLPESVISFVESFSTKPPQSELSKIKEIANAFPNISIHKMEKSEPITELKISSENPLSTQLQRATGDYWNMHDFQNIDNIPGRLDEMRPFVHIKTGKKFVVVNNIDSKDISLNLTSYKNPYEINRAIEALLDSIGNDENFTPDQKQFIANYSGYGGLEKYGSFSDNELKGLLYEYFTPDEIVKKMWALAYKYGFGVVNNPVILEPSVGTGNFLKYAPDNSDIYGNEINRYSKRICEILYPKAKITLQPFEKNFIERNLTIKNKIDKLQKYDLVIGNPPYGQANSKFMAMGEGDYTKARNFTEYFITRGLDLCKSGGLLIFVVGAEQYNGGTLFLDSGISEVKKAIAQKAQLVDAYRLPTKVFERTGVASEIIVFKKN